MKMKWSQRLLVGIVGIIVVLNVLLLVVRQHNLNRLYATTSIQEQAQLVVNTATKGPQNTMASEYLGMNYIIKDGDTVVIQ